jgi:hypothetical protein
MSNDDWLNPFEKASRSMHLQLLFGFVQGMEAKAAVFMADAIEEMNEVASRLNEECEKPITRDDRKRVILQLCDETFERLERERAADLTEWKRRYWPDGPKPGDKC